MRLFVAVHPSEPVLDLLAGIERPELAGVRWTARDQWHVTLRFLGRVEDPAEVEAALRGVRAPPSTAVLGARTERLGSSVLVVPVAGLDELADTVVVATAGIGDPPPARRFVGHLTLARGRPGIDLRPLVGVTSATSAQARFPVATVSLVRSHLGASGARHEVLSTFPLGSSGPSGPSAPAS